MLKKIKVTLLAVLTLVLFYNSAYGADSRFAVAAKASTLGGGVELLTMINSSFTFRAGLNTFDYSYQINQDDIEYDADLDLNSFSAILDWHPFKGGFRVSTGILSNENSIGVDAQSSSTYDIGDTTYSGADVGSLTGNVGFESVAPYIGVGWGNTFGEDNRIGFLFDVGVIFQGIPDVSLTANGPISENEVFLEDLAVEEQELKDDLEKFKYYPVVSLGMTYRYFKFYGLL